jgi:protein-S-isoprenylcysteine O-methyltransferase Ste14
MFVGLFLTWFNLLAAIPLLGIPGYVRIAKREEEMLELRFGNAYTEYQRKTGRFLPRL